MVSKQDAISLGWEPDPNGSGGYTFPNKDTNGLPWKLAIYTNSDLGAIDTFAPFSSIRYYGNIPDINALRSLMQWMEIS